MKKGPIVTIDGPSGSGKSTVARRLAQRLGYRYIDTGAMYRGIGWLAREEEVSLSEKEAVEALLKRTRLGFEESGGRTVLLVNDTDVTDRIRSPEMGMVASDISAVGSVREWLASLQRELGREGEAVLEGRDMGTVVFPDADFKFFLTASLEERAARRTQELRERGDDVEPEAVLNDMAKRDRNDSNRAIAPLCKAEGAIEIDTTSMTVSEVVQKLFNAVMAGRRVERE